MKSAEPSRQIQDQGPCDFSRAGHLRCKASQCSPKGDRNVATTSTYIALGKHKRKGARVVEHADAFVGGQKPSDRATVVLSQGLVKEPAGTSWARLNVASKPRHQSFDC